MTKKHQVATYRFSVKLISRADGRSAVAAAAYRAGERLIDRRTGEVADFSRRADVLDREILAPADAPESVFDRERLWNLVEGVEKRRDAQVARELQLSLPYELASETNRKLLHSFVKEQFVDRGMVADVAIHAAHRGGDERNVHAHVLLSTRHISPEGFGGKAREWNDRALLEKWRREWEQHVNRALEREQLAVRVSHQSYADRGIDREPESKQGPIATQMERAGRRSHAGDDRRAVRERNAERDRLRTEERELERRLREQQRLREEERQRADQQREAELERRRVIAQRQAERDRQETERVAAPRQQREERRQEEAGDDHRPGVEPAELPRWQHWREQLLSEAYGRNIQDSRLARFWRIDRTGDGLAFQNARGYFEDRGHQIVARNGNDAEIRGMLELAEVKGWSELTFVGSATFKRQAMLVALDRGFAVRAEGRDAELLREVEHLRDSKADSITRDMSETRDDQWQR